MNNKHYSQVLNVGLNASLVSRVITVSLHLGVKMNTSQS